jgi:altronate dehydratase small subunit
MMAIPAFQINASDNVATLLEDAEKGTAIRIGGDASVAEVTARQTIRIGHKVALHEMPEGTRVVKYGFPIGITTCPVFKGDWLHLHNCRSPYDARSSELSVETGSRGETRYV